MRWLATAALAACWTGDPPAPAAPAPRPRVRAMPAPRELSNEEAVKQLQDDLRQRGPALLPQLVDRGVVVLELDTGKVSTVCDAAAAAAAQAWAQLLALPAQAPLFCQVVPDQGARCMQLGSGHFLVLDLDRAGGWRLIGVISGVPGPSLGRAHSAYQAQLSAIACP